jgi:aminoglycoside phosphotransferase (APT) family kinase protein
VTAVADGIDTEQVTPWLLANVAGVTAPLTYDLIAGGHSNLTFSVTDAAGRRLVLRRPPLSHVLATAHDMSREYRIIAALRDTPVPVPAALAYCADEAVNGRPFYVMNFVDGYVLRGAAQTQATLDEKTRRVAGDDLVDVLVAIHQVDVDAVGLGTLARRDGYIDRQLRRWHGQFQQSQQQEREAGLHRSLPLVDEVHDILAQRVPSQVGTAIVHGDYRLDNTVVSADGRVAAVLDWELCTLGDPLADLGTLMMYWAESPAERPPVPGLPGAEGLPGAGGLPGAEGLPGAGEPGGEPATSTGASLAATALPGFPSRAELAGRYAARSGRDLADIGFYLAFAHWKLACIMEGVYVRYATHAMGGDPADAEVLGEAVADHARQAAEALAA